MNAAAAAIAAAAERSLGAGSAGVEKGVADLSMAEGLPSETAAAAPSASASAATNAAASTGDRFNLLPREDGSAEAADGASKDDDDAPEAPQAEEVRDPVKDAQMLEEAAKHKQLGNKCFVDGCYENAIGHYTDAIEAAPDGCAELAVFYANRAAAYAKLDEHKEVIHDCSDALRIQPDYQKALLRRAQALEAQEHYTEAIADMKKLLELDPELKVAKAAVPRLEKVNAAKMEATKEEMMGKLKDLGNTVLGKFGMSLDNFKAVQDPSTGSYNISFQQ